MDNAIIRLGQLKKLELVQVLRGMAALLVMMNHYPGRLESFSYGYIGVDLFFVISGLIMVITTDTKKSNGAYAIDFAIKRFSRIVPYYAVMTLLAVPVVYSVKFVSLSEAATQIVKSILLVPMWDQQPVLDPGWTLSLEMYFYVIFFVSLLLGRWRWVFLFSFFFLILCVSGKIDAYNHAASSGLLGDYLKMFNTSIVWCFVFGVVVGLLCKHRMFLTPVVAGVVLFGSMAVLIRHYFTEVPQHGPFYGLMFSAIVYSCVCLESQVEISVPRSLVFLGDISFSLYLSHFITTTLMEHHILSLFGGAVSKYLMVVPFIVINVVVAWGAYRMLEVPLDKCVKQRLRKLVFARYDQEHMA